MPHSFATEENKINNALDLVHEFASSLRTVPFPTFTEYGHVLKHKNLIPLFIYTRTISIIFTPYVPQKTKVGTIKMVE